MLNLTIFFKTNEIKLERLKIINNLDGYDNTLDYSLVTREYYIFSYQKSLLLIRNYQLPKALGGS